MEQLRYFFEEYLSSLHVPTIQITDVVEILIITFLVYHIMVWAKNTRAWSLFKGVVVILVFVGIAAFFRMQTILWIVSNAFQLAIIGMIVILQPELRKALDELGKRNFLSEIFKSETDIGLFSDKTIREITRAAVEMGKVRTGALIVVKQTDNLSDFEITGIEVDAVVSSQLLINIFEHNTPLHDGAVIIAGDRVKSATCYLPLSDNMRLSKELGTRHRAGVGISEVTDSLTVIVSEETGKISVAYKGVLERGLSGEELEMKLVSIQNKQTEEKHKMRKKGKGRKDVKKADE